MNWPKVLSERPPLLWRPTTHHEVISVAFDAALDLSRGQNRRVQVRVAGRHWRTGEPLWFLQTTNNPARARARKVKA